MRKIFFLSLILIFILLFFIGNGYYYDDSKPTEFFKIEEKWLESYNTSTNENFISSKRESFVLSNPPNDSSLLKKMVEEYNLRTMSIDTIKKYSRYERVFYRETPCLTRNYEEGKLYPETQPHWWNFPCKTLYAGNDPGQQIGYHYYKEENLMETYYVLYPPNVGYCDYVYIFGSYFGDTDSKRIKIKDIDQFFEEGRKKFNLN